MNRTSIAWVRGPDGALGFTWNPVVGCSPVSAGCANCWAARLASTRLDHLLEYKGLAKDGKWIGGARFLPDRLDQPLGRTKPSGIAVGLMGDLFHRDIRDDQILRVWQMMCATPWHRYFVLTKRAQRMRSWLEMVDPCGVHVENDLPGRWPLPNVLVGVSIEDQPTADKRIPELLQTPAAVRFVSAEPLIAPVDLGEVVMPDGDGLGDALFNHGEGPHGVGLDWVIAGGESGPHARPCAIEWLLRLRDQCKTAGAPYFLKQLGAMAVSEERACETDEEAKREFGYNSRCLWSAKLKDRDGANPEEWPLEYRVREFPEVSR